MNDREAWLFGKGPSIDTYDFSKANRFRFCVNEAVLVVPEPCGVFTVNLRVMETLRREMDPAVPVYLSERRPDIVFPITKRFGGQQPGSTACAVREISRQGFKTLHMVGFDSLAGEYAYADRFTGKGWVTPTCAANFDSMNVHIRRVIKQTGIRALLPSGEEVRCD